MSLPRHRRRLAAVALMLVLAPAGSGDAHAASAWAPDLAAVDAARGARDFARADSLALALIARLEGGTVRDSLALAFAHRSRGELAWARRAARPDPAARSLLVAAALLDHRDPAEAARLRLAHAALMIVSLQPDSALASLGRVAPGAIATDSLRAEAEFLRGRALGGLRKWPEATRHMHAGAAALSRAAGARPARVGEMWLDLATAWTPAADYDSAAVCLDRAREALESDPASDLRLLSDLHRQRSILARNLGDLAGSVELAHRALELSRRAEGDSSLAVGRLRALLGLRYGLVNDSRAAAREYAQAVTLFERHLGPDHFLTLNNSLQWALMRAASGDTVGAWALVDAVVARARADTVKHRAPLSFAAAVAGQFLAARGERAAAKARFEESIALYPPEIDERGTARAEGLMALLEIADGSGEAGEVERTRVRLETLADSTGLRRNNVYASARLKLARAEARTGHTETAWARALESDSLALEKALADARGLPDSRSLELAHQLSTSLDVLLWLAADAPAGRLETAWDRLIRWRGAVREQRASWRPRRELSAEAAAAHADWSAAQRRLARLVVAGAGRNDAEWRDRADAARVAAEEAERRFRRLAGPSAEPATPAADLASVLGSLGPEEALVSFSEISLGLGHERVVALLATGRSAPRCIDLGEAGTLRAAVARWRAELATSPARPGRSMATAERACRVAGEEVRRRIWDPVAAQLGEAGRVDLVASGMLLDLPWSALPQGRSGFLADSPLRLRVLDAERDRLRSPGAASLGRLLALGDPDRESAPPPSPQPLALREGTAGCGSLAALRLEALPAARIEVTEVAGRWREHGGEAAEWLGAEASERRFRAEAPGSHILHLATHGVMLDDTCGTRVAGSRGVGGVAPLPSPGRRSSARARTWPAAAPAPAPPRAWMGRRVLLALAGERGPHGTVNADHDGWLTAEEVSVLDLGGVDWVVLSACHAGLSPEWPSEGALGMRRAFRLAGARAVIGSLWAVEDTATREWMRALYDARAESRHASEAVATAHRVTLAARRASGRSTHPFYWAAFVSTGD